MSNPNTPIHEPAALSDIRLPKEVHHLLGAALRLVLVGEMTDSLDRYQPGARNLSRETRRVVGREVLVLLTHRISVGTCELRELALVGLGSFEVKER